jgi:tRNA (guanine-N(7)-)-methyltransferase subunit TRM82
VTVWRLPALQLVGSQALQRRASRAVFSPDSKHLLIADKNGDVYEVDPQDPGREARLLLGHLSMLLDLRVSLDGRFVITADRDEKIRVSRFPNSYNIHNFCLGHLDFVTSLSVLSDSLLVSGSGDGTVRLWRFLEGQQVASRDVFRDVPDKEDPVGAVERLKVDTAEAKGSPRGEPPAQPAVVSVLGLKSSLFVAQVEGFNGVLIYGIKFSILNNSAKVVLKQSLPLDEHLLDLDFDPSSETLFLLLKGEHSVSIDGYKVDQSNLVKESSFTFSDLKDFFDPLKDYETNSLENLHKRWFDNMKDYMEKKESRVEEMKRKDPPVKKKKVET